MTAIDSPEGQAMLARLIESERLKLEERKRGRRAGELLRALVDTLPRCDGGEPCTAAATCTRYAHAPEYACDAHAAGEYSKEWTDLAWAEAVRRAKAGGFAT